MPSHDPHPPQEARDHLGAGLTDERLDRNWSELMQELRVVQTGVQLLTGFLVTIPFTERFGDLTEGQRTLYLTLLVGSVLTTGLIVAPVAYHRLLFRQRRRRWLVESANQLARAGLLLLALVCSGVVLFVSDVVLGLRPALVLAGAVLVTLLLLWAVVPLLLGRRDGPRATPGRPRT
ncbi:sodium:proton antiporter [Nocardioides sp. ChNu-153]|uniref:DUF6328 family protein n=1 Tax=unclassified Nocardioides TaxID=2615069 RepID=UPI0024063A37|nr:MULTISPECIES: DUF6328 family protein [unclassified Nocardioides]MDF9717498.1 sodium:proton antiporter [Nocardioides sp. ChNu-99]MDN7122091.1 sodium:proton antiporter [Nocardioides sp. ChNu-153]